ncbi:unnamed protein product [Phaedon cochleariae]|uniref:Asparagine synthetase [glutamine-hydrolyzing] n=1 Tax=Phaedon cochleariae TaxID=80249 RepID=A0A9P0GR14_PHACE|nr:unnamed protein product [Phaedon cochleariae]
MCGIICIFSSDCRATAPNELLNDFNVFKENINKRGPDSFDMKSLSLKNGCELIFGVSVLWLQGEIVTKQPLENHRAVFLYNGDIYNGLNTGSYFNSKSDTLELFELFNQTDDIFSTLKNIQGPYAFIYLDKERDMLYFCRDCFGRKSLLIGKQCEIIVLTSVAHRTEKYEFIELPSIGLFCWDLKSKALFLYPFSLDNANFNGKLAELESFLGKTISLKDTIMNTKNMPEYMEPLAEQIALYENLENMSIENFFSVLFSDQNWSIRIENLEHLLEESVKKRISTQPNFCRDCIKEHQECTHSLLGVLFSGGVDCSILALLADKIVEKTRPIDLFNVAFGEYQHYKTPDRQTGLETLEELRQLCPEREWRFFEIDIPKDELEKLRSDHIADLIYPLKTILDDSLGCALWFASRGLQNSTQSPCRVLLVGMGADELFGGYTRHRAAFKKKSWLGLHTVLNEDWENLPYRNLARDDRVVSDHGRQLRMPYLDEKLVQYVRSLPCWQKSYPSHKVPQGFGEKILLRSLAYHIGLKKAAVLKKRALQFGSRIANKNENGHDISINLSELIWHLGNTCTALLEQHQKVHSHQKHLLW